MSDAFQWNDDNPLARAKHETRRANHALHDYVSMSDASTLRELAEHYGTRPKGDVPTQSYATIQGWSARYQWEDRIARYHELEAERERERTRRRRREITDAFYDKLEAAVEGLDPSDFEASEVTTAFKTWLDQARREYDDEPADKVEHGLNLDTFIALRRRLDNENHG